MSTPNRDKTFDQKSKQAQGRGMTTPQGGQQVSRSKIEEGANQLGAQRWAHAMDRTSGAQFVIYALQSDQTGQAGQAAQAYSDQLQQLLGNEDFQIIDQGSSSPTSGSASQTKQ